MTRFQPRRRRARGRCELGYWAIFPDPMPGFRAKAQRSPPVSRSRISAAREWFGPGNVSLVIDVAYSAVLQYLRAVRQAETATAEPVMQALRSMTVSDMFTPHGTIRMDGKMIFDRYMVRVKIPSESKFPWYYLEITDKIAAADAFRPLSESECRLVRS